MATRNSILNRHRVVTAIHYDLRACYKASGSIAREQQGGTNQLTRLAKTLGRSVPHDRRDAFRREHLAILLGREKARHKRVDAHTVWRPFAREIFREIVDRKSTRLNSSHRCIS